jgi:cobalt-precorrin 5A hydrolase/precorrin-3B C17-methyltransferase
VQAALREAGVMPEAIAAVGTLDLKADEGAVLALARSLARRFGSFDAARAGGEAPRLANPSEVVFAEVGCHGVAEGAALALAGAEGRLLVAKRKTANATCALGIAPEPLTGLAGRPRGRLSVVGIGPGQAAWRTPEASRLIAQAEELVGYGLYLDLLGPLAHGNRARTFRWGARRTVAGMRWSARARGGTWRWCARAMRASTPWRRWCSSCWIGRRTGCRTRRGGRRWW